MDTLPTSKNIADFTGRVWWADCLDLLAALPDKSVDMVLVDLPYGVTACTWDNVIPFEPMWEGIKRIAKKKAAVVMTATEPFASTLRLSNIKQYRYDWVWDKVRPSGMTLAKKRPMQQTESILVFSDGSIATGANTPITYYPQMIDRQAPIRGKVYSASDSSKLYALNNNALRTYEQKYPVSLIRFAKDDEGFHSTQKPVALFEYLIRTYTLESEIVLDFCSGSATTAIACLNLDRQYICGDSHLPYVELSRQRIASHDPFVDTPLKNGLVQKSLFASTESEGA